MNQTACKSLPIPGDKLYQLRAAQALPILVRQADARQIITYGGLAAELGMPNPRNLNYVLGSVGSTISKESRRRGIDIPPIQALVINQGSGLPGHGFDSFNPKLRLDRMTVRQRRFAIQKLLDKIFCYDGWNDLLVHLGLKALQNEFAAIRKIKVIPPRGGESKAHKDLKRWVKENPKAVGISAQRCDADAEWPIPSGDSLDVFFRTRACWTAIEVKSIKSSDGDLMRGIYQCVKYQAVLEALLFIEGNDVYVQVKLALEGGLSAPLRTLSNRLGVTVIEYVRSRKR